MLSRQEIKFSIDLFSVTIPNSKILYCMGRAKLGELNHQLMTLRLKKLVRSSSS